VKGGPNKESPLFPPRGDISPSAPAFVSHDQRVYVTEGPQIHDLDHSSRFKSETPGEMSGGGTLRKNNESDFARTADSDVHSSDTPVHKPLRPW
jgi:hypothetical protein